MSDEKEAVDLKVLAEEVVVEFQALDEIKAGIEAVKAAWAGESNVLKKAFAAIRAGVELITDVVHRVEALGVKFALAGDKKKELAVAIINKLVDIPYVPEQVEAILIGFTVDAIVAAFNRKFGKAWL